MHIYIKININIYTYLYIYIYIYICIYMVNYTNAVLLLAHAHALRGWLRGLRGRRGGDALLLVHECCTTGVPYLSETPPC